MTHKTDIGYEFQSGLLVSDRDGAPLVAPAQDLVTAAGGLSSKGGAVTPSQPHLDELGERMIWLEKQGFGKPLVHIVDREADSVAHLRRWSKAGQAWLVRVKEGSRVRFGDREMRLGEVGNELAYAPAREAEHRGKRAPPCRPVWWSVAFATIKAECWRNGTCWPCGATTGGVSNRI